MNTTKQRTHQRAVELDELGWRWALKLADLDRREGPYTAVGSSSPASTSRHSSR